VKTTVDGARALDDVVVGDHEPVGRDDEAGPGSLTRLAPAPFGQHADAHHGGRGALHVADHRVRVGIEQLAVVFLAGGRGARPRRSRPAGLAGEKILQLAWFHAR
jgi:hypothetical protein